MAKASTTDTTADNSAGASTPDGAGTAYTQDASASANSNGKASATVAGGNPVTSPVIGNPGENRPDMGYDYSLAGAAQSTPLTSAAVAAAAGITTTADDTEYAELVRARQKGHYDGLKEVGEVFSNDRNLATYPEDSNSWFEDADRDVDWEIKAKTSSRRKSR